MSCRVLTAATDHACSSSQTAHPLAAASASPNPPSTSALSCETANARSSRDDAPVSYVSESFAGQTHAAAARASRGSTLVRVASAPCAPSPTVTAWWFRCPRTAIQRACTGHGGSGFWSGLRVSLAGSIPKASPARKAFATSSFVSGAWPSNRRGSVTDNARIAANASHGLGARLPSLSASSVGFISIDPSARWSDASAGRRSSSSAAISASRRSATSASSRGVSLASRHG
mmetsp:Transcript_4731/g.21165  ORF Transcript_4731/g.21165 Transcript_4731/m.21165 type:complete len:231 (+) Transcript_4731:130-822(+)